MARIFVYGTLKRGGCQAQLLQAQRFLGTVRTVPRYRLYDAGDYPAMVESRDGLPIEGELWEVDGGCLAILDRVEGVPDLYVRAPVFLEGLGGTGAETYLYRQSIAGLTDCGPCWLGDKPFPDRNTARGAEPS